MGRTRFFDDDGMDFAVRCVLTGVRYGMAEVGEVLATVDAVVDGDADSWTDGWLALGRRVAALGTDAETRGHRHSAWGTHLRAANYLACANFWVPESTEPDRYVAVWHEHRGAWDRAVATWPTTAEVIAVPFEGDRLDGWWFPPSADGRGPGPVVVLVNGIEAPASDLAMTGLADAVARGYGVLALDGPGQGRAFWDRDMALRPDWQAVVGAGLDWLLTRPTVDPGRVALMGISSGSLLAARAAAHLGDRVAALVLDPGVVRLTAEDLDPVRPEQRPTDLAGYALTDGEVAALRVPTYVAEAERAIGFVGQPAELAARLAAQGTEVRHDRFTVAEGAGLDCEIGGPQIRNQRVYDWLDDHLRPPT
jgi:pimeloyl-ACP methyl ester carboxylesterase